MWNIQSPNIALHYKNKKMAKKEFKIMQNGMECVKNRNSWSMKKQPAKRSPVHTVILSTLACWGLSPGCPHSQQISQPVLYTRSWILGLCTAINRQLQPAALGADLRALLCIWGCWQGCLSDPAQPHTHCTFVISLPAPKCGPTAESPAASHGIHRPGQRTNISIFYCSVLFP